MKRQGAGVAAAVAHSSVATGRQLRRGQPGQSIHWHNTLASKAAAALSPQHLRFRHRQPSAGVLHCLVLDCSASMLQAKNLALAKGMLLQWVQQIYRQRADIAVIGFGGQQAQLLQSPRKVAAFNADWIAAIRGGGGTPVRSGLQLAESVMQQARRKNPQRLIRLWLLSDGRFPDLPPRPLVADACAVVDFENTAVAVGRAALLAAGWQADYLPAGTLL